MKTKTLLTGVIIISSALASFSQVTFTEKNASGGTAQMGGKEQMFDKERKVWVSGSKGRIMSRSTEGASETNVNSQLALGKSASTQNVQNTGSTINDMLAVQIANSEAELAQLKQAKKQDKAAIAHKQQQIDEMKAKQADTKEKVTAGTEKLETTYNQVDTKAATKEGQEMTGTVDIIRIDKGMTWTINSKAMTYQETKFKSTTMPPSPVQYIVDVKEIGKGEMIAGHETKKYNVEVAMNAGGQKYPSFSAELWVAEDLDNAKIQLNTFNNDYKKITGVAYDAYSQGMGLGMTASMVPEFAEKVNAIKGMVLKKVLKQTITAGPSAGEMTYTALITKISTDPIDDKMFELPEGVKKQK